MKPVRKLIFDLDGTLIDSSAGVVEAVNYSLRMTGQPEQPPDRIKPFIGYPLEVMYPEFTSVPFEELYAHFQKRARETVVQTTVALDGADATVRELAREGYRMAIATTKISRHVQGILELLNWKSLFVAAVGGDDVERVKPAPDAFLKALELLEAQPDEAVVIGDTVNDIAAARAVPMVSVAVKSPYGDDGKMLAVKPDHYLMSVVELPELLAQLNQRSEIR